MAKQESGFKANIGSSSLILIFIVMCLVTFGMLSLTSAKSDLSLANRNADAVTEYYRADTEGEAFYLSLIHILKKARAGKLLTSWLQSMRQPWMTILTPQMVFLLSLNSSS